MGEDCVGVMKNWFLSLTAVLLMPSGGMCVEESVEGVPEGSPEAAALEVAAPLLENKKGFLLREDYWKGELSQERGKAVRLQFFKGNSYKLILATGAEAAGQGAKVFLQIIDLDNKVVAASQTGEKAGATALVTVNPKKTGAHLVLMRVEGGRKSAPAVLFYGYE